MTSCRILSCGRVSTVKPMRLPGTCSRYSKNAIPQLTSAATYQGRSARFFRCAYQANVMKTFEAVSRSVARTTGRGIGDLLAGDGELAQRLKCTRKIHVHDARPAARTGGGDVVRAVVDEHRGGRGEGEAPLGLGVDVAVRLHGAGEVGG